MSKEPVKKHCWIVRVRRPGKTEDDTTQYQAAHGLGPVTAEHVRTAPSVKRWIGNDRLVSITPADAQRDVIAGMKVHDLRNPPAFRNGLGAAFDAAKPIKP